jgi:putative ABC transport system permease protein
MRGFGLLYSMKGLATRLQTTSFAVAALGIAVSMMVGITLMVGSFRETLAVWVNSSIRADIYITTPSWRGRGGDAYLDAGIIQDLSRMDGVRAVDRLRAFLGQASDGRVGLAGVDMGLQGGEVRFPLLEGAVREAFSLVETQGEVLIGETLARRADLWTGDSVAVQGPYGSIQFPIAGVYYDYSTEGGAVVMDHQTMSRHFGPGEYNSLALYLEPGLDAEEVVDRVRAQFSDASLLVRSNQRLKREIFKIFDQTFAVTRLLQVMSLLIAVCGIALMLLVLAREQVSELALCRAIGADRRQVFRVFLGKGLGMGAMGLAMGLAGGAVLAVVLIFVINRAYFGWTIQVYWPWEDVLQQGVTILTAAVAASLYPALRASQTPATELSRENV